MFWLKELVYTSKHETGTALGEACFLDLDRITSECSYLFIT